MPKKSQAEPSTNPPETTGLPETILALHRGMTSERIPLESVHPYFLQARSNINDDDLEGLCSSIVAYQADLNTPQVRRDGLMNAPMVISRNGQLEVFAGERRIRALRLLHQRGQITRFIDEPQPMVTVSIFHGSDLVASTMALVDNLGHVPLDAFEGTYGILNTLAAHMNERYNSKLTLDSTVEYVKKLSYQSTTRGLGRTTQKDRAKIPQGFSESVNELLETLGLKLTSFVASRLPVLSMQDDLRKAVIDKRIDYTQARLLKIFKDVQTRTAMIQKVGGLTLEKSRDVVKDERKTAETTGRQRKPTMNSTAKMGMMTGLAAIKFLDVNGDWYDEAYRDAERIGTRQYDQDDMTLRECVADLTVYVEKILAPLEVIAARYQGTAEYLKQFRQFREMMSACQDEINGHHKRQR